MIHNELCQVGNYYYPFYSTAGYYYPEFSRPYIFTGGTYQPYEAETPPIPNDDKAIPASSATVVQVPPGIV